VTTAAAIAGAVKAVAVPLLLVALVPAAPRQAAKPAADVPIEVVSDVDDPRLKQRVRALCAETWKEACALYGVDAKPEETPASLNLYREVAGYEAACDRFGAANLKRNQCFTEWTNGTAHVLLQPPIRGEAAAQLAPTWQTLRVVVHEMAHVVRGKKFPNRASHPKWFYDGNACWLEEKVLAAQKLLTTPEQSPFISTEELDVQRLLKQGKLPSIDDLVHDRADSLEFGDGYSVRYLLFRFLADGAHGKELRAFIGDLRSLGGGGDFVDRCADALKTRLGAADWKTIDAEFHGWLAGLKPEWDEPLRSLATVGDEWTQTSFDDANAVAFRTAPAGAKRYALEGSVTLLADRAKSPQANLLLGRVLVAADKSRFVSLALVPGAGATLFDYDASRPSADQWQNLAFAATKETAVGKPVAFRVECEPKGGKTEVTVKIAGKALLHVTVDRLLDGPWGLGAQAGSSCLWRGVKLTSG
jgi:hypothetical protein